MRHNLLIKMATLGLALSAQPASAATVVYTNSASFLSQLSASFTDTYSPAQGYGSPTTVTTYNDEAMTAIVGQASYHTTTFAGINYVGDTLAGELDGAYCSGCNGSFELGFSNTSFTQNGGVFGVGFDVDFNPNIYVHGPAVAFVTFADNSTANFALPVQNSVRDAFVPAYFGITSDLGVKTIHIGGFNGVANVDFFVMDNLTIGSARAISAVPERGAWNMMIMGFGMAGAGIRRRRRELAVALV